MCFGTDCISCDKQLKGSSSHQWAAVVLQTWFPALSPKPEWLLMPIWVSILCSSSCLRTGHRSQAGGHLPYTGHLSLWGDLVRETSPARHICWHWKALLWQDDPDQAGPESETASSWHWGGTWLDLGMWKISIMSEPGWASWADVSWLETNSWGGHPYNSPVSHGAMGRILGWPGAKGFAAPWLIRNYMVDWIFEILHYVYFCLHPIFLK